MLLHGDWKIVNKKIKTLKSVKQKCVDIMGAGYIYCVFVYVFVCK